MEIWKPIKNYPEFEVSNLKRVKSTQRILTTKKGQSYTVNERVLKQYKDVSGNNQIIICKDNRKNYLLVDILYFQAFVSTKEKGK